MESELGWACALAHAWIEAGALERFDALALPAAVVDTATIHHSNEGWKRAFGRELPSWAASGVETVLRTNEPLHLAEIVVAVAERTTWLAATLMPIRVDGANRVVIACGELTDSAIARELRAADDACVWSGGIGTPAIADYSNQRLRDLVGGVVPVSWQSIVYPDDLPKWSRALEQTMQRREPADVDIRIQHADGAHRWHTVRVSISRSDTRWFAVATDCHHEHTLEAERTELLDRLRAARVDAEQAHRVKDQVLAAVSHELRAPVTTMMLWERVLRDPMADAAARVQALDAIQQSALAQSRIVADLLDMARAISGKLYVDFRNVEVGRVVGDAVEAALPAALAKRISLTHDGSALNSEISGDASRLRQVMDNLLSNAIKFTEPGGRVAVTIQRKGRIVSITVEDNGRGIPTGELTRIFEPFSQGSDIISRREGGLGLGLAIAKQIVELHHGTLTAFSEGPKKGARLLLTLPTAGQRRAPSPPAGVVATRALKSVRVLVIDDDERVRNALALLLDRAGAIVDRADSAGAAREQMSRRTPQVIVCDIAMPDEDGYEFIRALRAAGNKIPAIALTAYATQADAQQAVSAGFDLHVAKPVDFQRLVASLSHVIDSRRNNVTV
jgi:signal transduction histidine kinase/ActR/RegA family two-component response regulator